MKRMPASPPKPDELEVSLFGPGRGECVLVHLGAGDWLIVDSCRDQRSRRQPALEYLRDIGVDVATAVRVVVASHWHSDHVSGISDVVTECVSADFWTSAAFRAPELLLATGTAGPTTITANNPFREFYDSVQALQIRSEGFDGAPTVKAASAATTIFRRVRGGNVEAYVEALSPSPASEHAALAAIAAALPDAATPSFHVREPRPNEAAIALRVQVGVATAILGSDLEQTTAEDRGWKAVVSANQGLLPRGVVFKVAHHGSSNAHNDGVWSEMLTQNAHATLTPFRNSSLPRPADIARLRGLTTNVHLTASPEVPAARRGSAKLQAALRGTGVSVQELDGIAGHVRVRVRDDATTPDACEVTLFEPARSLG
jgi:hypothetical protein